MKEILGEQLGPVNRLLHGLLRLLGRLPEPLQLLLAGGRITRIDGQLLEPEVQLVLRLLPLLGKDVPGEPPEDRRARIRSQAGVVSGRPAPMRRVEELAVPGPGGSLPARLYVPHPVPDPSPLLIYFHGGGFVTGGLDTHDGTARFLAREAGLRVMAVDYRLAPEHPFPAAIEDGVAALRFAAGAAERLGIDPKRVAVGGDSAGGNLAASVSLLARGEDHAPAFQLLIYPVTDWSEKRPSYRLFREGFYLTEEEMDWYRGHFLGGDADAARDPRASPLLAPDLSGAAPAYLTVAGFDPLRDEGMAYAQRLEEAGVPVQLRVHSGLVHGFANATAVGRASAAAMREAAIALREGL